MNPGGLVLMVFAVIAGAQLFAGQALQRLRILPSTAGQTPTTGASSSPSTTAPPGVTVAPSPGAPPSGVIVTPGPQTQAQPGPPATAPVGG